MRIPFTTIRTTRNEMIGTGLAAVGGWMAFSAAFSTAPIWATLIAIPATVAAGVGAVKVAKAGLRVARDYIEDYASEHPGGKVDRWFAGEYQPDADLSDDLSDDEDLDDALEQDEAVNLINDLGDSEFNTLGAGVINFLRNRVVTHTVEAADDADYTSQPTATTRSGKSYRS